MLPDFALYRPATVAEAVTALDEDHVPLCGGTELLLAMSLGLMSPRALVDVGRLDEMRRLDVEEGTLVVGAAVTHREVHRSAAVQDLVPLLADVEAAVGNARVRAQGSVGGNLCFAEPKSDLAAALIALDADVVLAGPGGVRYVPVASFIEGPYSTIRGDDELLVEVRIPTRSTVRGCYLKFQTMERPTVGVAAVADGDRVRIVVGAVGPIPVVSDFGSLGEVDIEAVLAEVDPMPDLTGSVDYKRHVTEIYLRKAVAELS